jgi:hypothetical protein
VHALTNCRGGAREILGLAKMMDLLFERKERKGEKWKNDMRTKSKRKIKQIESKDTSLTIATSIDRTDALLLL